MKYNTLKSSKPRTAKRLGRGISAGQGKTAGRGTKGQNSRSGSTRRLGFEGGQNPLVQRLPKLRGFQSHKAGLENVYTDQIDKLRSPVIDNSVLAEAGLISSAYVRVKIIQRGDLKKKATVKLQKASTGAIKQIEAAGGKFIVSERVGRAPKDSNRSSSSDK